MAIIDLPDRSKEGLNTAKCHYKTRLTRLPFNFCFEIAKNEVNDIKKYLTRKQKKSMSLMLL